MSTEEFMESFRRQNHCLPELTMTLSMWNCCSGCTPHLSIQRWWLTIFSSSRWRRMKSRAITMTLKSSLICLKFREALLPSSLDDFNSYMERMLTGGEIAVGPTARALAQEILYPRSWILWPAGPLFRLITAGLLPERLREGYGLGWNEHKEKRFRLLANGFDAYFRSSPDRCESSPTLAPRRSIVDFDICKDDSAGITWSSFWLVAT